MALNEDIEIDYNLLTSLEKTQQRLDALNAEFKSLAAQLMEIQKQIQSAAEKYSVLAQTSTALANVIKALDASTAELGLVATEVIHASRTDPQVASVQQELAVATKRLSDMNAQLAKVIEHAAELERAKQELEIINRGITTSNEELSRINRELKAAHDTARSEAKAKTEFLANMSHEIRTPMSGLIGMCEMLLLKPLDEDSREIADDIFRSAKNLLRTVDQLLDFSKIQSDKMQPERIKFSLAAVIERVVTVVHRDAERKGLTIKTFVEPRVPPVLVGDEVRVEKILLNLVHNAVKFTSTGEVLIEADVLSEAKGSIVVRLSVTDTGIGISEEAQKQLFQPFVQADSSTTRKYGGTGLGLSIAKRLVALLSGDIGITSTEGKGSTFWFAVPFERA